MRRGRGLAVREPLQFNEPADLERYPRDEQRDRALARTAGADLLFAPRAEEVYPSGFSTSVEVLGLTDRLEGAVRGSAHFKGVTTVVTKLLNMVSPDVAYFGQKDAQQVIVIKRLVEDLDMPVRIEACPTVREPDGLAMSSRNAHLSAAERLRAVALSKALVAAGAAVSARGALSRSAHGCRARGDERARRRAGVPGARESRHARAHLRAGSAGSAGNRGSRGLDPPDRQRDFGSSRSLLGYEERTSRCDPQPLATNPDSDEHPHSDMHPEPATPRESQAICSA